MDHTFYYCAAIFIADRLYFIFRKETSHYTAEELPTMNGTADGAHQDLDKSTTILKNKSHQVFVMVLYAGWVILGYYTPEVSWFLWLTVVWVTTLIVGFLSIFTTVLNLGQQVIISKISDGVAILLILGILYQHFIPTFI